MCIRVADCLPPVRQGFGAPTPCSRVLHRLVHTSLVCLYTRGCLLYSALTVCCLSWRSKMVRSCCGSASHQRVVDPFQLSIIVCALLCSAVHTGVTRGMVLRRHAWCAPVCMVSFAAKCCDMIVCAHRCMHGGWLSSMLPYRRAGWGRVGATCAMCSLVCNDGALWCCTHLKQHAVCCCSAHCTTQLVDGLPNSTHMLLLLHVSSLCSFCRLLLMLLA
jgi:hypothetical protein